MRRGIKLRGGNIARGNIMQGGNTLRGGGIRLRGEYSEEGI